MKSITSRLSVALGLFVAHTSAQSTSVTFTTGELEAQGRQGSGQEDIRAGLVTGIPAPGSTVDDPQIDLNLFRPFCFIDEDCQSGNCENGNNDLLVQDIPDTFYCGPPQGDENCQAVAAAAAEEDDDDIYEFQRIDNICNNLVEGQELWGSRDELQLRRYNGVPLNIIEELSGAPESITPRVISDEVINEPGDIPNQFGTSTLLAYTGQFIDHDVTLIEFQPPETRITIEGSPPTDNLIVFELSVLVEGSEPVLNPNSATPIIDLSMVYGSDRLTAYNLRKPGNLARLDFSVSEINGVDEMFLPLAEVLADDDRFVATAMSPAVANLFAAGDIRTNEQTMLMSFHTAFMREHNRLVNQVVEPELDGVECEPESDDEREDLIAPEGCELIYQVARRVNIAQWQQIVFSEYISAWHDENQSTNGPNNLIGQYDDLGGYNDSVTPAIDIFFSTSTYRFGHTIVRTYVVEKGPEPEDVASSIFLGNAFFNPSAVLRNNGVSGFLFGASEQCGSSRDQFISTGIRNFLFGSIPGSEFRNSDLPAFNIERCRDHECPLYNDANTFYNLDTADTFEDVVRKNAPANFPTPECYIDVLNRVFGEDEVDNMDPFVGMLMEPSNPAESGQVGALMLAANDDQFRRMMIGDRFMYLNEDGPTPELLALAGVTIADIRETTLANVLNGVTFANAELLDLETGLTAEVNDNQVFQSAFIAPATGEGECCVNDGDLELTPVCFRNETNIREFFVEDLTRCDALSALEAQAASFGAQGGFIAGTMLPITFESYNCNCKLYVDEIQTAQILLALQDRPLSQQEIIDQLLADIAALTGETYEDISSERMPQSDMVITANPADNVYQITATCNPTENTDSNMGCQAIIGLMEAAVRLDMLADDEDAIMTSEFAQISCLDCPPTPSDFTGLAVAADGAEAATLLGFDVAVGAAILGGAALVVLLALGCGARAYMNKKNQQQVFTSGQESV